MDSPVLTDRILYQKWTGHRVILIYYIILNVFVQ